MKKTAVVTGASSGMGREFVRQIAGKYPWLEEIWAIARRAEELEKLKEEVQDFYPTPSTMSTCMYYTGIDPRTGEKVYVPKDPREKAMQRALLQYRKAENHELVREALEKAGRTDLIGSGGKCLIRSRKEESSGKKSPGTRGQSPSARERTGKKGKKKTIRNIHQRKTKR